MTKFCVQCGKKRSSKKDYGVCLKCASRKVRITNIFQKCLSEIMQTCSPEDMILCMLLLQNKMIDVNASYHAFLPISGIRAKYNEILSKIDTAEFIEKYN